MTDRLTELQFLVDGLAKQFYNSVGNIQLNAPPVSFGYPRRSDENTKRPEISPEEIKRFAVEVVAFCKQIEQYIEYLPGLDSTEEEQINKMKELEKVNYELGQQILLKIENAERLHNLVTSALQEIAQDKLNNLN
uniref:Mediator of RNA polymerase II transcription subunit 21 n=1 Tax=Arcella intermedia TaxID=1963864 RepID=A0A6B2LQ17_9EUKA